MFKKKKISETTPIVYNQRLQPPNGLAFKQGEDYFLVKSGKLLKFFSERVFSSWGLTAFEVGPQALKTLRPGGTVGFRDGSLVKNFVDGKLYLVSDNKRRLVTSPDVPYLVGKPIIVASEAEINLHDEGDQINDGV